MIAFTNERGLRDFRASCVRELAPWPRGPWLIAVLVLGLAVFACARPLVVLVVPAPLTHNIGAWLDEDQVCVPQPALQAIYITRRCLSMAAIRLLILSARTVDASDPHGASHTGNPSTRDASR